MDKHTLPEIGFLRIREVLKVFPVSKSTWWAGIKIGRYPKPVKLGIKITAWRVEDNAALVDFSMRDDDAGYINLIGAPSITQKGEIAAKDQGLFVQIDEIYVVSDLETVFAGLFEIIYQIRNLMIHGSLLPEKDEHEIVKYTYMVLREIMPK